MKYEVKKYLWGLGKEKVYPVALFSRIPLAWVEKLLQFNENHSFNKRVWPLYPSNICNGSDNVNSISSSLLNRVNWRAISVRKSPNTTSVKKHLYKHNTTAKPAAQQLREIHLAWISLKAEFHCPVSQKLTAHEGKDWCHLSGIC